ncbi:hypothetical protein ACFQ48_02330 [Hymenobacter caeli]|uniref:Uncharacterized protein n=1 Tax=Hymenobacter caeli TaxID=2735894 RepID=A0ABX2FL33_9BACT|nr:hypothetical protein [Hymenobacter caeli]NRT17662.1 hypothetical protein [Hymenobacter caeli]
MLSLNDSCWEDFTSGYQIKYDVSQPLRRLEAAVDSEETNEILDELWDELHHQGDVGTASYLAVPQLIRIGIKKTIIDRRLIGLVALIEIQRHVSNISIPQQYEEEYHQGLQQIENLIAANKTLPWKKEYTSCALAALAASKGQIDIARIIQEFDDPDLTEKFEEFLNDY